MKRIKYLLAGTVGLMLAGMAAAQRDDEPLNTRIDNTGYWQRMIRLGKTRGNPVVPVPAPVYTSAQINSDLAMFVNSPDVAITSGNSQSENSVFVNHNNKANALNSNNSLVSGNFFASEFHTFNTGSTWAGLSNVNTGSFADPATGIDNGNRWYIGYINSGLGQSVSRSLNNGATWTKLDIVATVPGVLDKNHLWVDNSLTSPFQYNLYSAWTRFQNGNPNNNQIEISRSTDNGTTWSAPVNISTGVAATSHNQGVNLQTGPSGEVYAVWAVYDGFPTDEKAIGFAKSTNGGVTYTAGTRIINNIRGIRTTGVGKNMRVNSFPSMAVDISYGPNRGNIYVVWCNIGTPGVNTGSDADVYVIRSTNGGTTWSAPIKVNGGTAGLGKKHYFPWITCDPSTGALHVIFYDDRNTTSTMCEAWVATSCDAGATWSDFKVSDVAFTPSPIPGAASGYMGDYIGITAFDNVVYPVWTDNRSGTALAYTSPFIVTPNCNCALNLTLQGITIIPGMTRVFRAQNTITVNNPFTIQAGGNSTFLAGQQITVNPGFTCLGTTSMLIGPCNLVARTGGPVKETEQPPPPVTAAASSLLPDELTTANIFSVYPNPAEKKIVCSWPYNATGKKNITEIIILDLTGKLAMKVRVTKPQMEIDISKLKKGGYLLNLLENGKRVSLQKLIVH